MVLVYLLPRKLLLLNLIGQIFFTFYHHFPPISNSLIWDLSNVNELNIESTPIESNEIMDKSSHILSQNLRGQKEDNVIIAHLNINILQNKFEPLAKLVQGKIDILIISETKIDESFTSNQFINDGYSTPFREDRNSHGGVVLIFVREDIPCKRLKTEKNI